MLDVEWDDSPAEENFLRLNLDAVKRGVFLERIFVVKHADISMLLTNKAVKAQVDNAGKFLTPLIVEREYLETHDPQLIGQVGAGLSAFDRRVALIDSQTPDGLRGYVTMNPGEIARLRRIYENLRVHARDLVGVVQPKP